MKIIKTSQLKENIDGWICYRFSQDLYDPTPIKIIDDKSEDLVDRNMIQIQIADSPIKLLVRKDQVFSTREESQTICNSLMEKVKNRSVMEF
jgi:hypothetical protein